MQRHVQHYNIEAEIGSSDPPIISLQVDALIGEEKLRIKGRLETLALEYICEESNNEPEHDGTPYDEGTPLECDGAEDSTVKY